MHISQFIVIQSCTDKEAFSNVNVNSSASEKLLTWPMKSFLDWRMFWGYINNDFILNLFLAWYFTLSEFRLCNVKLDFSSREFVWELGDLCHVGDFCARKTLTCWRARCNETASLKNFYNTYCTYVVIFKFNTSPKKFFVYCFLFVCLILTVSEANAWNIEYLIFKYLDKIYYKDKY